MQVCLLLIHLWLSCTHYPIIILGLDGHDCVPTVGEGVAVLLVLKHVWLRSLGLGFTSRPNMTAPIPLVA
jgi:hypothetical protein